MKRRSWVQEERKRTVKLLSAAAGSSTREEPTMKPCTHEHMYTATVGGLLQHHIDRRLTDSEMDDRYT